MTTRKFGLLAAGFLVGFATRGYPTAVAAADVVILKTDQNRHIRVAGEILNLTGDKLIIRRRSGREESIDPARIVDVESSWTADHREADKRFEQRDYQQAQRAYRQALKSESRGWVQRRIAARLVWCNRYRDRIDLAGQIFRTLYRADPSTRDFAAIPLAWTTRQIELPLARAAQSWLEDQASPVARLMGASWLLTTSSRADAVQTLGRLRSYADPRVAFLAEAQLWRTRTAQASREEVARWSARVARMPAAIRAGPYAVLASAYAQHGLHDSAALSYLRIPILYPAERQLSAQALLAAARLLDKMARPSEARGLYRELVLEYPDDSAASEARRQLGE